MKRHLGGDASTKCTLISGPSAEFVQLSLAVIALGSLLVKRFSETPRRPWLIWLFDVGKQGLGAIYAHFLNIFVAMGLNSLTGGSDECAWYLINYVVDCTVGLVLAIVIIKLLECWANRHPAHSWQRLYVGNSGDYGSPPSCTIWSYQTAVWLGVVSATKLGLFCFLVAFRQGFDSWGHFIFRPLKGHPQAELVIVMVIVPCTLNVVQFWVVDNVIMARAASPPSAPLSPTKDNFKVSYRPMLEPVSGGMEGGGAAAGLRGASPHQRRRRGSSASSWLWGWWPFSSSSSSSSSSRRGGGAAAVGAGGALPGGGGQASSHRQSTSMDSLGELMDDINGSGNSSSGSGAGSGNADHFYRPPPSSVSSSSSASQRLHEPAWISEDGIRLSRRSAPEGGGFAI